MRFVDEYRDPMKIKSLVGLIKKKADDRCNIMEVCGGQTHAILRFGLHNLIEKYVSFVHGPGCPVCVTSPYLIDKAIELASRPNIILCSYGDMIRVPGTAKDLITAKAEGADVRVVYSPAEALQIATENTSKEVVFFAIGFETTSPGNGLTIIQAERLGIVNYSLLSAQVLIPPAIELILQTGDHNIDGLLAPGHVCTITGSGPYEMLAAKYDIPIVIAGFEPLDILRAVLMLIELKTQGKAIVANQYKRVVQAGGNPAALKIIDEIFEKCDCHWRGLGEIQGSGLRVRDKYRIYDAEARFELNRTEKLTAADRCIAGLILRGRKKPYECPAFGVECRPEKPLGAPMVSGEGACAAYYHYDRTVIGLAKAGQ